LKRVQKIMHGCIVLPKSVNVVFQRLCFALHKGLSLHLVVCLPFVRCNLEGEEPLDRACYVLLHLSL
jgi:hypothetical protein